ncbi:MAG: NAD(P)H-dependent glycerol-3-phosphate dehydrogenase [Pseudomonadota bacterium]
MIAILGAGAFGAAIAQAPGGEIRLWGRGLAPGMAEAPRLPGHRFPRHVQVAGSIAEAVSGAEIILLAVPMGAQRETLDAMPQATAPLIACSKGIDPETGLGPVGTIVAAGRGPAGLLTGPSFARDIARGLPTALTLAMPDGADGANGADGAAAQERLSSRAIRPYRSSDITGAELGGALKNVLAIASGAVIGAGLGPSAQAALLTRGFAEVTRLAVAEGARKETLMGLSGMGDLMLTAYSPESRNYRYGHALGRGETFAEATTVEGVATAAAVARLAARRGLDLPVLTTTHRLISGELALTPAMETLMSRPLKEE